jgi:hypothetical protein
VGLTVGLGVGSRVGVGWAVGVPVGAGVGVGGGACVGGGVDREVGAGVLVGNGVPVGPVVGAVDGAEIGLGVGPTAISEGVAEDAGATLGDAEAGGVDPPGPMGADEEVAAGADAVDGEGLEMAAGVALAAATGPGGVDGPTKPAVRATVARMRFSTPIATTRRARCVVVNGVPRAP